MLLPFFETIKTSILPPSELFPWLTHTKSLTKKLKEQAGEAHLIVLKQYWRNMTWWNRYVFELDASQPVFQREIIISAQGKKCWYARTIIPAHTYHTHQSFFARLEHESLGHLIFDNQEITRLALDYYLITPKSIEYYWLKSVITGNEENLWGRLAVFTINTQDPFYLVEIFLPDLLKVAHELE
ncbi:4-hydroxybenzoate synthetase [Legionella beliardensis]|uniref:4-hydroxybenzoate synthetase n=1 Tax=Legionella beliardensis TaxID=91822 RepID=A0A378I155_9GAMM|nr:chorismate lyase [Legionella beliardensis]STX28937.1 4-hydroxybenzoate synthetase [Legionella beliardensis]